MERPRAEGAREPVLERWVDEEDERTCGGCRFLAGRVFFAGNGPQPPLHWGCRCRRHRVVTARLSGVERMRLALEAERHRREARMLLDEAVRRTRGGDRKAAFTAMRREARAVRAARKRRKARSSGGG